MILANHEAHPYSRGVMPEMGKTVVTAARLAIRGLKLPRMEDALMIGEVMRMAAIATTESLSGSTTDGRIALARLSGHDLGSADAHAAYLPEDADHDGMIDHLLVCLESGFNAAALEGLSRIRRIWQSTEREWDVEFVGSFTAGGRTEHSYLAESQVWASVTPYLYPWFRKKNFGIEDQILRECRIRGWPPPIVRRLDTLRIGARRVRPSDFVLNRSKHSARQPDRQGSFWRLTFPQPVCGPITLGFARHWGLGIWRAERFLTTDSCVPC